MTLRQLKGPEGRPAGGSYEAPKDCLLAYPALSSPALYNNHTELMTLKKVTVELS